MTRPLVHPGVVRDQIAAMNAANVAPTTSAPPTEHEQFVMPESAPLVVEVAPEAAALPWWVPAGGVALLAWLLLGGRRS